MIIDTWALDALMVALCYLSVTAGSAILLEQFAAALKYKAITKVVPSILEGIKVNIKGE